MAAVLICKGGLIKNKVGVGLFQISQKEKLFNRMFLSCHVDVFSVIPHSIAARMSRNSLLEAGAKAEI